MNYFTRRVDWTGRAGSALTVLALALSLIQPLMVLGLPLTAQAVTPTTIFSDSFLSGSEGNEFPNWTFANAKWDRESGGRTDAKKAAIEDDTGTSDDLLMKATSTVGFSSVTLSYWYKINHDLGPNDHVYVEWSSNNGSTWNVVADHKNLSNGGPWAQNTIVLTGADGQSGFQFRFRAHLKDTFPGDHDDFWLEDVLLTGIATPTGSIAGQKWDDQDGDGGKGDEPGLAGWTINLIKDSQVASTTITDNGGNYLFKGLEDGTYKVCEVNQDLWKRTSPTSLDGCHDVTISAGASVTGKDFGNVQQSRIILNKVTNPEDSDDEFSFTGTAVDATSQSPITLQGTASTSIDLAPGSYTLTEGNIIGWDLQSISCDDENSSGDLEAKTANINVSAGETVTCTFTNWQRASLMLDNVATPNEDTFSFHLMGPSYEDTKTTIGSGRAKFEDLVPGAYSLHILTDLLPSGWQPIEPTACWNESDEELDPASLTLNPGDDIYCVFTNVKEGFISSGDEEQGLIMGRKFNDNDMDGKRDKGEKGLKDWTINLYQKIEAPETGEWSWPLLKTYQTIKGGRYMFSNLDPGLYHICEVQQQGWNQSPVFNPEICVTENTDGQRVEVRAGEAKLGINFGNWHTSSITGFKWNDKDGDGKRDAGEEKLSGWTIELYSGDGETKLAETTTDGSGRYEFTNLNPDTYVVKEVNQPGWSATYPVGGEQTVVLLSNQIKKRINFGNWHDTIAPTLSIGLGNGNSPENTGPEHGQTYSGLIDVFATLEDASPNSFHFRVVKDGGNMGNSCGSTLGDPENQGYNKCGYPFNLREATSTSFTNAVITTLDAAQLAAVAGYGDYWLIIGADDTAGNRANPDWTLDPRVKITIEPMPEGDHEAPVTVITSPNPETEWVDSILITGTTTDNVKVASTTLSYAIFTPDDSELGGSCGTTYTPITTLGNPDLDAVFDWTYNWTPAEEGIYCIQANGTDTSGNEEHTFIVPKIKFKKIAKTNPEEPTPPGGVTGSSGGGPSIFGRTTGTTTPTGQGGTETGQGNNPVTQLLAGAGLGNVGGGASTTDLIGEDGTSTPTSTKLSATSSPLLAALGNLGGWWWWILLLILIAAGLGYWYWNKKENE